MIPAIMRRGLPIRAAACAAVLVSAHASAAPKNANGTAKPDVYPAAPVRPGAATPALRREIRRVNDWWVRNHTAVPCDRCDVKPPGTTLIWTFYKGQGLYPNWVRASREVLARRNRGDHNGLRTGTAEILKHMTRRTLARGVHYRVIRSAYDAPDGQPAPWVDAMGAGLILTLIVPSLPDNPTPLQSALARERATEHLRAFGVNWRNGGLASKGPGRGLWYLEYAYRTGASVRVLNGSMQALVSLDRFSRQAGVLAQRDPSWRLLQIQAQDYVIRGSIELARTLHKYDVGGGRSRYSLSATKAAPIVYHLYHVDLLRRLEDVPYIGAEQRAVISDYRRAWGGAAPTGIQNPAERALRDALELDEVLPPKLPPPPVE